MIMKSKYVPFRGGEIPPNGVYCLFERGEQAHGGDRIVYVGTHRVDGRLPARIRAHFKGARDNSIFRKHVGEALDKKLGREVAEQEISDYIQRSVSFAVLSIEGGKAVREKTELHMIEALSGCHAHTPSDGWPGRFSPHPVIRHGGLWNVQGVDVRREEHIPGGNSGTLVLIPCCARKKRFYSSEMTPMFPQESILDYLSPELANRLKIARSDLEPKANVDKNTVPHPAISVSDGFLYNVAGFREVVLDSLVDTFCKIGIISGAYGIVLPTERIHWYNCSLQNSFGFWVRRGLPEIISKFAQNVGAGQVFGFFGKRTAYANIFRRVPWQLSGASRVYLCYPRWDGGGGAQVRVPRFLGKAVKHFLEQRCEVGSLTGFEAERMQIKCKVLFSSGDLI